MRRLSEAEFAKQFFSSHELDEVVQRVVPGSCFTAPLARALGEKIEITGGKRGNSFLGAGTYVLRTREPEIEVLALEWQEHGIPETLPEPSDRTDDERGALGDDGWSCAGSNTLRQTVSGQITDEDRAAARLAGMSIDEYLQYSDVCAAKGGR